MKTCKHYVLGPRHLPCPECYGAYELAEMMPPDALLWPDPDTETPTVEIRRWERIRLVLPGGQLVCGWRLKHSDADAPSARSPRQDDPISR